MNEKYQACENCRWWSQLENRVVNWDGTEEVYMTSGGVCIVRSPDKRGLEYLTRKDELCDLWKELEHD